MKTKDFLDLQAYMQGTLDQTCSSGSIPEGFRFYNGSSLVLFAHRLSQEQYDARIQQLQTFISAHGLSGLDDPALHLQIVRLSQLVVPVLREVPYWMLSDGAEKAYYIRWVPAVHCPSLTTKCAPKVWDELFNVWDSQQISPDIIATGFVPLESDLVSALVGRRYVGSAVEMASCPQESLKLTLHWGFNEDRTANCAIDYMRTRLEKAKEFINRYSAQDILDLLKVLEKYPDVPNANLLTNNVKSIRELYQFKTPSRYTKQHLSTNSRKALKLHLLSFMAKHPLWLNSSGSAVAIALEKMRDFKVTPPKRHKYGTAIEYCRASRRISTKHPQRAHELAELLRKMMDPVKAQHDAKQEVAASIMELGDKIDELGLRPSLYRRAATIEDLPNCVWVRKKAPVVDPKQYPTQLEDTLLRKTVEIKVTQGPVDMPLNEFLIFAVQAGDKIERMQIRVPRTFMFIGYTTSLVSDAKPIFEWDGYKNLQRNPVSFYSYGENTSCTDVSLLPEKLADVTAIAREPWCSFGNEQASEYFSQEYGKAVVFLLHGCVDRTAPRMDLPSVFLSKNKELGLSQDHLIHLENYAQQTILIDWNLTTAAGMAITADTMVYLTMTDGQVFAINIIASAPPQEPSV